MKIYKHIIYDSYLVLLFDKEYIFNENYEVVFCYEPGGLLTIPLMENDLIEVEISDISKQFETVLRDMDLL